MQRMQPGVVRGIIKYLRGPRRHREEKGEKRERGLTGEK